MDRSCAYYAAKYWCCVCHKVQFADKGFQEKREVREHRFYNYTINWKFRWDGMAKHFFWQFDNMHQSYPRLHTQHSWYISRAEGKGAASPFWISSQTWYSSNLGNGSILSRPTDPANRPGLVLTPSPPKCSLLPNLMSARRSFNPLSVLKLVIIKTRKWKILCSCFKIVNRKAKAIVNDNLLDNWIIFIDYESWQFWIMLNSSWTSFLLAKEL